MMLIKTFEAAHQVPAWTKMKMIVLGGGGGEGKFLMCTPGARMQEVGRKEPPATSIFLLGN